MVNAHAQKYNTLAGIRIGDDFGISFAQRIANKNTVELNIQPGTFAGNTMYSALIKQHYSLITKRFNFFLLKIIAQVRCHHFEVYFVEGSEIFGRKFEIIHCQLLDEQVKLAIVL